MKIKAVIFDFSNDPSANGLADQLRGTFDTAVLQGHWSSCWNRAWELFPDYDVLWGIDSRCSLKSAPPQYVDAMSSVYPFGLWSAAISGDSEEYMRPLLCLGRILSVRHLEGVAFAMSAQLWQKLGPLDESNRTSLGYDQLACFLARRFNLKNILDGRVELEFHQPDSCNTAENREMAAQALQRRLGSDWCDKIDWWFENRINYCANAASQILLRDGERKYSTPFHRK